MKKTIDVEALASFLDRAIEVLLDIRDAIDVDPDMEPDADSESNFANDAFGDEREYDPAEWGIGDKDGLIEQNCSVYEVAA